MGWILLLTFLMACQREEAIPNSCGVQNPLSELAWLKKLSQNDGLGKSIVQGNYQGQTVYAVYTCGRCFAGGNVGVYRCDGAVLCSGSALDNSANGCAAIALNMLNKQTLVEYAP